MVGLQWVKSTRVWRRVRFGETLKLQLSHQQPSLLIPVVQAGPRTRPRRRGRPLEEARQAAEEADQAKRREMETLRSANTKMEAEMRSTMDTLKDRVEEERNRVAKVDSAALAKLPLAFVS